MRSANTRDGQWLRGMSVCGVLVMSRAVDPWPDSVTTMTNDNAAELETRTTTQPTWTRLVGIDSRLVGIDFGQHYGLFKGHKPFQNGERVPVDPPGTVVIVRGSGVLKPEGDELVLEYVVQLERPGNGVA
jgi:hypothetical protein